MVVDTQRLSENLDIYETIKTPVTLVLTEDCNMQCQCCFVPLNNRATMTKDVIDASIQQCKNILNHNLLSLSGGEPTLELDLCEYAIKKAQDAGLKTRLITNGWWGKDEKIIKKIYDFNLDYLYFSVDSFHNNEYETVKNIFDTFSKHNKTYLLAISLDENYNRFLNKFDGIFKKYNAFIVYEVFYNNESGLVRFYNNKLSINGFCINKGFKVYPDGKCVVNCYAGKSACSFGNVLNLEEKELKNQFLKYIDIYPLWFNEPGLTHCFGKTSNSGLFDCKESYCSLQNRLETDFKTRDYKDVLKELNLEDLIEFINYKDVLNNLNLKELAIHVNQFNR